MKMNLKNFLSAAAIAAGLSTQAFAQDLGALVSFTRGANDGALAVAQSSYGKSRAIETAIIDIDGDEKPEIAVRFPNLCSGNECTTAILYQADGKWVEVFNAPVEKLTLSGRGQAAIRNLETGRDVYWTWYRNKYLPKIDSAAWVYEAGEPSFVLSRKETEESTLTKLHSVERYLWDVTGDGVDDSILVSRNPLDCGGWNICPYFIFEGQKRLILKGFATEGLVGLHDGKLAVQWPDGFKYFAFNGQHMEEIKSVSAVKVISR